MTLTFIKNTNVQNMLPLSHLSQRSWELAISLACSPLLHLPDMLQVTPIFGRIFIRTRLLKKKKKSIRTGTINHACFCNIVKQVYIQREKLQIYICAKSLWAYLVNMQL